MADLTQISRFIALILRHKPEAGGIELDAHGWADTKKLIGGVRGRYPGADFNMEMLERIVREDDKQRFAFSEDRSRIRANQGHSVKVDVELETVVPPIMLFHGTGEKYVESIRQEGLKPRGRLYVHLSQDAQTAEAVGARHGRPVVLKVESGNMHRDGFIFYRSQNGVYLTDRVPAQYLQFPD